MPELPPGTTPRILCYGDSLTAGLAGNFVLNYAPYAKPLAKLMGCEVDHVGLSGWTTQQMVEIANDKTATDVKDREWKDAGLKYRLDKAYKNGKAYTCVIIMAGTNDLGDLPPERIASNLMTLHNFVRDYGAVSVAVAIPKHGALCTQVYAEKMGEAPVKRLKKLVHNANLAIKAAVQVTNDQGTDACQITYVDVHHEMLKWCGDSEEEKMNMYAGFPTLGDYRDFMMALCEERDLSDEDVEKMTKNFASYSDEDFKKKINDTKEGSRIKKGQPQHYASLDDGLHFSAAGYKLFAEALHSKVFARDGGRTARERRSGGGTRSGASAARWRRGARCPGRRACRRVGGGTPTTDTARARASGPLRNSAAPSPTTSPSTARSPRGTWPARPRRPRARPRTRPRSPTRPAAATRPPRTRCPGTWSRASGARGSSGS